MAVTSRSKMTTDHPSTTQPKKEIGADGALFACKSCGINFLAMVYPEACPRCAFHTPPPAFMGNIRRCRWCCAIILNGERACGTCNQYQTPKTHACSCGKLYESTRTTSGRGPCCRWKPRGDEEHMPRSSGCACNRCGRR
jgi:hypothetical protein